MSKRTREEYEQHDFTFNSGACFGDGACRLEYVYEAEFEQKCVFVVHYDDSNGAAAACAGHGIVP
ncbi:hypothetical protein GCM10008014_23300 [Paenibacillus silvae]|uniref:Uncharacterized protein n=1 Tax=Paenibacillus silvae TaxID=1325358 RepID=A0ABQ1Z9B2_9BACL|nr:hypothetical protein GCM10008014_23300 [Paenibacillus silvae]